MAKKRPETLRAEDHEKVAVLSFCGTTTVVSTHENDSQSQPMQEVAPERSVPTRPGKNGGTLRSGNHDAKGGDFSSKARRIRIAETAKRFLDKAPSVASDPDHPKFSEVGRWAVEQLDGKAKQTVEGDLTAKVTIQITQGLGVNPEGQ